MHPNGIDDNPLLTTALEAAVPLHIMNLTQLHPNVRERVRTRWAADGVDEIAYRGDTLQFGSKKRGEAAAAFNALARALAAGAFQPGGITFCGLHWCVDHTECVDAERQASERPSLLDREPEPAKPSGPTWRGRPVTDVMLPEVA
ncbi:hypothetical protein AB0L22_08770 [Micromonospora haikouensis]|uniref:hypothetical protein n=1 Tax=Micromonospora haikouensis TaxID=686309 RepID=UPI00342F1479